MPVSKKTCFALLAIFIATFFFYWKILLTHQFSLLTDAEGVHQAYSWFTSLVRSLWAGELPMWDPNSLSGHVFAGEMQTAPFYPLNLLLALAPFNQHGVLSPALYNMLFVLGHLLAAGLMFALLREFQLGHFASLLGGLCFSLGGFVSRMPWPHMLQSSIWLPLIFLFLLRALRTRKLGRRLTYAWLCGLCLGVSILAGGFHLVILQTLVVIGAVFFHVIEALQKTQSRVEWRRIVVRSAAVLVVIGISAGAAGAIQLLPSIEYSQYALRFLGATALPANKPIPYLDLQQGLFPHAFVGLLMPYAFASNMAAGEASNPYMGVLPLFFVVLGVWKYWARPWVKFFAGLAVVSFLYSLGSFSLLHGLLYALVPRLWMAREAGRVLYLVSFAMAILAAFGAEALFRMFYRSDADKLKLIARRGLWIALLAFVPFAVFLKLEMSPWISFSLLMIAGSCCLVLYILGGHTGRMAQLLVCALTLFDLSAFDWIARNKSEAKRAGVDQYERSLSLKGAAAFLKSQPGLFRVQVLGDAPPNIGDLWGVPSTHGAGATLLGSYAGFMGQANLLKVSYFVRPASASEEGAVYQDADWKVYRNPDAFARAWLVGQVQVERSEGRAVARILGEDAGCWRKNALLEEPLLEPLPGGARDLDGRVAFVRYQANTMELRVDSPQRSLLVLSENYYPGWTADVNGGAAKIYKVNGALRGVVTPAGTSVVRMMYQPRWMTYGGWLTFLAFAMPLFPICLFWMRRRSASGMEVVKSSARSGAV